MFGFITVRVLLYIYGRYLRIADLFLLLDLNCSALDTAVMQRLRPLFTGYILVTPPSPVVKRMVDMVGSFCPKLEDAAQTAACTPYGEAVRPYLYGGESTDLSTDWSL